jgi:predicted transcriptional regulator
MSRLGKGDAAKPNVRRQVYDAVRRYPGIHVRGLERNVGVSAALVSYHLKKLVEEAYVEAHDQGGYARYYPTAKGESASVTEADLPLVGLLREEVPLHVALLLLDHGPLTHGELVEKLGVAKSTASYHLAKLADLGIVERVPGSTKLRLAERDRIYRLLLAYTPTPDLLETFAGLWEDLYG